MGYDPFEEYKAVIENTVKLSDRRQTVNDILVGLNVFFATGVAYLIINSHLHSFWVAGATLVLCLATLPVNLTWLTMNHRFSNLIRLRIHYLQELEQRFRAEHHLPHMGVHLRELEDAAKFGLTSNRPNVGFAALERRFIYFFLFLFPALAAITIGLSVAVANGALPGFSLN